MQYDDDNKGAIWNARERASDKHPHFTGKAMVDGTEYYVSAWKRDPDGNPKAPVVKFSFKKVDDVRAQPQQTMQQPQQATAQQYAQATGKPAQPSAPIDFDDDIPF
jgi:hypothetical protein